MIIARRSFLGLTAAVAASAAPLGKVRAQSDIITWKIVCNTRLSSQYTVKWKWLTEQLMEKTDGRFRLDVVAFSDLGMTGTELIRMLSIGLVDGGEVVTGYISGELPIVEGAQMVGCYENLTQARQAYEGWLDEVIIPVSQQIGGKPISSLGFTTQCLWSKFPVSQPSDMQGKKIRVFAKAQADFVSAFGASPVSMPISEVYSALERGVVDGAVTGPETANGYKFDEVIEHGTDLLLGPGAGYVVISQRAWDGLSEDIRGIFEGLLPEMRRMSWAITAEDDTRHLAELRERGLNVTFPAKPEWVPECKRVAREVVVPQWAERAGPAGVAAFNKVIAPIVGFEAG
tara:strand:+ start:15688 stop:16719 length:1032 start_codon:yes stop_codon:yes gene_type:complete